MPALVIKKTEEVEEAESPEYLQVVYAEVYAPNRLDAHNEYMTEEEIRKMAWRFMATSDTKRIDVMHDNNIIEAVVVESFIAREDDPIYIPGSWVVGVYVEDKDVWQKVLDGELNGFSMEAYVIRDNQTIEIDMPQLVSGETSVTEDHTHRWYVSYTPDGQFLGGSTDRVNGHFHEIKAGTITEKAAGHHHKFSTVDDMDVVPVAQD